MRHTNGIHLLLLVPALLLSACSGSYSGGDVGSGSNNGNTGNSGGNATAKDAPGHFASNVSANMDFCRTCHVPGGVAAQDELGRDFMLSTNKAEDYAKLQASWERLGRGVESSPILTNASGETQHSGGAPWPRGSAPYSNMKILLGCWDSPASCAALLGGAVGGGTGSLPPLLGDLTANGGRNYAAQFCEGKADATALPQDPRELISGDNLDNPDYAVWYNDEFEVCETPVLFENQRKQNEILVAKGMKPIYSAKPRPATCGEWKAAVERGRKYIMHNAITGEVLTRQSLYNLVEYLGYNLADYEGRPPSELNELIAAATHERYGWPKHPYPNPFPLPGEDPNLTNGGSVQLPIAVVQTKDENGKWTGKLGVTCYACHIGQIGKGEVVGNSAKRDGHPELYGGGPQGSFMSINGSNTDAGLALYDIERANGTVGPNAFRANLDTPGYMANRTRGSNAADQEIVNVLLGRNFETLDWRNPLLRPEFFGKLIPSAPFTGGDQDMPTWWWTHNKTRYLWVGFGSAGSGRGNFFPSSTNPENGHWSKAREGDYQDLDTWLNAIEAPKFVGPPVDIALAEQGAILFHSKDLWADGDNSDIPRPPVGNGSCASCHGAYSPRYGNEPGFLPDPRLIGYSGATVPMNIIGTDGAQSNVFTAGLGAISATGGGGSGLLNKAWFGFPDTAKDFVPPESRPYYGTPFGDLLSDLDPTSAPQDPDQRCKLGTKGGYTAQPLHGVWASGPYFHNGSVPTVWDVLKPDDRPDVWLRQQVPLTEAGPGGERGFDTDLQRAYDYDKLGWKYQALACDALNRVPYLNCSFSERVPTIFELFALPFQVGADYFSPPYILRPGEGEVESRSVYNTHAYSKGNQGHEFTKALTDAERKALIEYLKTL